MLFSAEHKEHSICLNWGSFPFNGEYHYACIMTIKRSWILILNLECWIISPVVVMDAVCGLVLSFWNVQRLPWMRHCLYGFCSSDVELLAVSFCPYYLPREFTCVTVVELFELYLHLHSVPIFFGIEVVLLEYCFLLLFSQKIVLLFLWRCNRAVKWTREVVYLLNTSVVWKMYCML